MRLFHLRISIFLLLSMLISSLVFAEIALPTLHMSRSEYVDIMMQLDLTMEQKEEIEQIYEAQHESEQALTIELNAIARLVMAAHSLRNPEYYGRYMDEEAIEEARSLNDEEIEQLEKDLRNIQEKLTKALRHDDDKIRKILTDNQLQIWYVHKCVSPTYQLVEEYYSDINNEVISEMCQSAVLSFLRQSPHDDEEAFQKAQDQVVEQIWQNLGEIYEKKITITRQWISEGKKALPLLREKLKTGMPREKEEVLDIFEHYRIIALVPDVIAATLDSTLSPRHIDTGWCFVGRQAASHMADFARWVDGISIEERGQREFTFYDDIFRIEEDRLKEIHNNWTQWWQQHKTLPKVIAKESLYLTLEELDLDEAVKADITITNRNEYAVRNMVLECYYYETGILRFMDIVPIATIIEANESKTLRDVRIGEPPSKPHYYGCTIDNFELIEEK